MAASDLDKQMEVLNAQIAKTVAEKVEATPSVPWWSVTNAMTISASVLVFGVFTMVIAALMMRRGRSADSTLKMLGTLVIIICAVFLVVAGYSDTQIAPVVGLLGTIAGYLLGKNSTAQDADTRQRDSAASGGTRGSPPPQPPAAQPVQPAVPLNDTRSNG